MKTENTLLPNSLAKPIILFIFVSILSWFVHGIITHGAIGVSLHSQERLGGQVSQALATNSATAIPQIGIDYKLEKTKYFNGNSWVISLLRDAKDNTAQGFVVLKKIDTVYVPILGPGTIFPSSYRVSLPPDVGQYLEDAGAFYDAS